MKRHIYLHTSDISVLNDLYKDCEFFSTGIYNRPMMSKAVKKERGHIELATAIIHLVAGEIEDSLCPWCGCEPVRADVEVTNNEDVRSIRSFMLCDDCGARGPILDYNKNGDEISHDVILNERYAKRRAWDADLKNPYEEEL